jgi:hypothetical protein
LDDTESHHCRAWPSVWSNGHRGLVLDAVRELLVGPIHRSWGQGDEALDPVRVYPSTGAPTPRIYWLTAPQWLRSAETNLSFVMEEYPDKPNSFARFFRSDTFQSW